MRAHDELAVRRATPADAAAVVAVGCTTYREHFGHIWSPQGIDEYLAREMDPPTVAAELASERCCYLLASRGSEDVGYAKLRYPRPLPGDPTRAGVELQKLYVRAGDVGGGVGARLLDEAVAHARALGHALLWLDVLTRNVRAQAFYRRHGFEVAGTEAIATDLGREELLVMVRAV